jgi:hypothetical protein
MNMERRGEEKKGSTRQDNKHNHLTTGFPAGKVMYESSFRRQCSLKSILSAHPDYATQFRCVNRQKV